MTLRHDTAQEGILVAFGANLPERDNPPEATLRIALAELAEEGLEVVAESRLWRTPCFPAGAGPDYVNGAARLEAPPGMGPADVLAVLHRIEARHGRERLRRWAGRTLDLDLLAWGDSVLPDGPTQDRWRDLAPGAQAQQAPDTLVLPHPRLQDRAFVLVPLAEVAPNWRHPRLGQTVLQMLAALSEAERAEIRPL